MLFVLGASLVTGVLAGALPALRASKTDLNGALKEGGRNDAAVGLRTRRLLIVCEVSLSLVLLMGAGVMFRTLLALRSVDTGYNPHDVLTLQVSLPGDRYKTPSQITAFFTAALQRMRALPGCRVSGRDRYAAVAGRLGAARGGGRHGRALAPRSADCRRPAGLARISADDAGAAAARPGRFRCGPGGLLVSASAARLLWGEKDPIGTRVTLPLMSRTVMREVRRHRRRM